MTTNTESAQLSYFNINGSIGRGAYEIPEFPTAGSMCDHLDYLGVDRSLVWHVVARDFNPTQGNRRLLDEIHEAGKEDRLIPAFVITPACFYEFGTLDFLRQSLSSGRVRALRIMPDVSRFQIRELERILAELDAFSPVVFWDCGRQKLDPAAANDLALIASQLPNTTFVLCQVMWGGFGKVLDLMWRCDRICVDTSWLHMRQTIELLTENFGAERVLFGLGPKSHYGAAIAALAHAEISDEQRQCIAHGNCERLLGLAPVAQPLHHELPIHNDKPLWKTFRSGQPISGVRVIDSHGHNGPHTRGWYLRQNDFVENLDALRTHIEKLGIERLIVSSEHALFGNCLEGNTATAELMRDQHDRFSGYLVFNPRYSKEMVPRFDAFFEDPFFVGFKVLPAYWRIPLTDPGYRPIWDYANRHQLPILMHTWDDSWNSPSMLKEIVAEFPNARYLLGHSGGGTRGRLEAEQLALAHPTVFLEFCGSFTSDRPFETSMEIVGIDRVVYGSDTGAHDAAWELGRFLSLPIPDDDLKPGLGETMLTILR